MIEAILPGLQRLPPAELMVALQAGTADLVGHGITKPKASRAVMQHNLAWFNHYLWGDAKPDLSAPELPDTALAKKGS